MVNGESYMGEERRAEQHVHVDSLPGGFKKSARRMQIELALIVTVLLAIFGILLKNSVDIARLQAVQDQHNMQDDTRAQALANAVSNLTDTDDRVLLQIERLLTHQEDQDRRLDALDRKLDR